MENSLSALILEILVLFLNVSGLATVQDSFLTSCMKFIGEW